MRKGAISGQEERSLRKKPTAAGEMVVRSLKGLLSGQGSEVDDNISLSNESLNHSFMHVLVKFYRGPQAKAQRICAQRGPQRLLLSWSLWAQGENTQRTSIGALQTALSTMRKI